MYSDTRFKKSTLRNAVLLALSINGAALALSTGDAQAALSACGTYTPPSPNNSINFTMLAANGGVVGGTNDVVMAWDGQAYNESTDYAGPGVVANVTASSTAPFFGHAWTAHDIQVFAPGSYSFDVTLSDGRPGQATETGTLNATVGAGQLGMHMLFDWNGNFNIDVFVVLAQDSAFGSGLLNSTQTNLKGELKCSSSFTGTIVKNCLYDGALYGSAGAPVKDQKWMLASTDPDGDGVMGIPMPAGGPFAGFNANFNMRGTLSLTSGSVCAPSALPAQFTFMDVTGIQPSTLNVSDTITVSGLGTGVSASMSIAGGEYSTDGGSTWASTNTTVQDNATVKVRQTSSANSDGTKTDTTLSISGVSDTYSVTVIDKKPAAFSFTSQTGVAVSTQVESNTITVSGMDTDLTTPINITGGEYSKDGGTTWTNLANTVTNGNTVKVRQFSSANPSTTTIATLTLGQVSDGTAVSGDFSARTAGGINTTDDNFTMLDSSGNVTGGTNDVVLSWDQQYNTSTSDRVTPATAHMQLSSVTPFFGYFWTAHHIRVFGPGTYTINVDCTTAQIEAGSCATNEENPGRNYTFTVGANQIGAHMLFDWNTTKNIDVVDIWDQSAVFAPSQLFTGAGGCANPAQVWNLMSSDWDNDGQNGAKMIDGPFVGFSANFNLRTTTPALTCGAYTPTVNVSSPSGAGGCSINPTPTNLQARADWWLVAGFLAWLGGIRIRLKRRQTKS